jgi:deoxyhypusine synthase
MTRKIKTAKNARVSQAAIRLEPKQRAFKKRLLAMPVSQCDLEKIKTVAELVEAYAGMSVQARCVGQAAKVFEAMLTDKDRPTIMLGLAGPLIAGGLRKVIRDMVRRNLVDVIVSTGAILYQDFYQARGFKHYVGTPDADDAVLRKHFIDRIYDTYVDEEAFWQLDAWIARFADELPAGVYSSRAFLAELGKVAAADPNSILGAAFEYGVPVFCPALSDSSIGIGLAEHYHHCRLQNRPGITIDVIRDNYELTQIVVASSKTAAFYVAGGVPKNYINDSIIMMSHIFGKDRAHSYALQLTTDAPHWGGLSGSTLSEAKSWGKIDVEATHQMAFVEPTVALPLLVASALQKKLAKNRPRLRFRWQGDILLDLRVRRR